MPGSGHAYCSYQSSCGDHSSHRKHDVHCHWCAQPGQRPRVAKVFHDVPHASNGGSGPSPFQHTHVLDASGSHSQRGHLMRPDFSESAGAKKSLVILAGASAFLNNCHAPSIAEDQNKPTIRPSGPTSIESAAGTFGRPGIVMISPQMATTNSAPADSRTSRTLMM
jgi:hypothetical protein